jgi:hypothetical protein
MNKNERNERIEELTSKVSPSVRNYADQFKADVKTEKAGEVLNVEEKEPSKVWETNLPEGLTPKLVKSLSDYNAEVTAGAQLAIGEIGLEAMKKDKELKTVTGTFKFGTDTLSVDLARHKQYHNPANKDEQIDKFGVMSHVYEHKPGKSTGQVGVARKLTNEIFAAAFHSKK